MTKKQKLLQAVNDNPYQNPDVNAMLPYPGLPPQTKAILLITEPYEFYIDKTDYGFTTDSLDYYYVQPIAGLFN